MTEENKTQKPTSRVIDSLHSEIDELKSEREHLKLSHDEFKKRNAILTSKNDSLLDQLANYKHENDMINALLKRKERRITDLEAEFDLLSSESESLKLSVKNYKIRCDNLQESLASSAAEFERLKIAYDAIVAAQSEYKRHYQEEIAQLTTDLSQHKKLSAAMLSEYMTKIESNDRDVDVLLDSLTSKRKSLDSIYVNRNKTVLEYLGQLARAAKLHGEESRSLMHDNIETINLLREKIPDLQEIVNEHSEQTVDLDTLLGDSNTTLESDFGDLSMSSVTSDESASSLPSRHRSTKKNRQKKGPSRFSPEAELYPDVLPKSRNGQSRGQGLRSSSNESSQGLRLSYPQSRNSSSQTNNFRSNSGGNHRNSNFNNSNQTTDTNFSSNGNMSQQRHFSGSNTSSGHRKSSSQLPTPGNNNRGPKKGGSSPSMNNSGFNQQNNRNNKRRLFYGGSNNYNIANNDQSPHSPLQKAVVDVDI